MSGISGLGARKIEALIQRRPAEESAGILEGAPLTPSAPQGQMTGLHAADGAVAREMGIAHRLGNRAAGIRAVRPTRRLGV